MNATIPAARARIEALPPADTVRLAWEGAAYVETVRRLTVAKSEHESEHDQPAVRVGRYCIVPPRAAS